MHEVLIHRKWFNGHWVLEIILDMNVLQQLLKEIGELTTLKPNVAATFVAELKSLLLSPDLELCSWETAKVKREVRQSP